MIDGTAAADGSRSRLLILRPDLYAGHLLTMAIAITVLEVSVVAFAPRLGQTALVVGWCALVVLAFDRLRGVKVAHQLTSRMQPYRFLVGLIAVCILGWIAYVSFGSVPQALQLPLLVTARFLVIQNMIAAINSAIVAALGICVLDAVSAPDDA